MVPFKPFRNVWKVLGQSLQEAGERRRRRLACQTRSRGVQLRLEQLESRAMLSVVNLTGTAGNDVITFQQTDATHDTYTLNGTPNTFSTVGVTSITIDSGTGSDNISILSASPIIPFSASGTGSDTFTLGDTQFSGMSLTGGSGTNKIIESNGTNSWIISPGNSGTVNGVSFSNIQNLTGGTGSDTFTFFPNGFVSGAIDGGGGDDALDYSNRSVGVVVNLQTASATAIGGGFTNITSLFGATASSNTLTGANTTNIWSLSGPDSGTINGTLAYSSFQNLTGGTGTDTFAFASGGSVSGQLKGGGGSDTLDYSALSSNLVVDLSIGKVPNVGGGVSGVHNVVSSTGNNTIIAHPSGSVITASGSGTDTLNGGPGSDTFILSATQGVGTTIAGNGGTNTIVGPNATSLWNITSSNLGSVNGVTFTNIQNLTGGTANDTFAFKPNGVISGAVNGGGATDTLDYSARTAGVVVNLQTSSVTAMGGGFSNITSLIGSSGPNTLTGANTTNTWNISGTNSGTVNATLAFSGFQNLTGGTGNDTFAFASGGSVTGQVRGGGGSNTLDYSALSTSIAVDLSIGSATGIGGGVSAVFNVISSTGSSTITAYPSGSVITDVGDGADTLKGGPGNDTFILSATEQPFSTITGYGGSNTIIGPNVDNSWYLTALNAGVVNRMEFRNIQNLTGGTGIDHFYLNTQSASLTGTLNGGSPTGDWLDYGGWNVNKSDVNLATGTASGFGAIQNIQNVRAAQYGGTLTGNSLGNILIGGPYSGTTIQGGSGRSLLLTNDPVSGVPDQSPAALTGGSGNDIIIGKDTSYDMSTTGNDSALASILAEWQSANSYATRIAHINGTMAGGLNGTNYLIFGTTVIDSPGTVTMAGGAGGMNWFFKGVHDEIYNLQPGEQVN